MITVKNKTPNFVFRDLAGLICVLLVVTALVAAAFLTGAGPLILMSILILLIFGLLRHFRERGREDETQEVAQALRTRLHKDEKLLDTTIGDRRRLKPLAALADFVLMLFTQGLAADGAGAVATDDTLVGLTDQRLIAIDRQKRPPGQKRGWRERLNLQRLDGDKGKHAVIFETPLQGATVSIRLAVFYLARLNVQTADGRQFSIGINSRYWAKRAVTLSQTPAHASSEHITPERESTGGKA